MFDSAKTFGRIVQIPLFNLSCSSYCPDFKYGIDLIAVLSTRKAKVVRSLRQCAPLQPKIFFMYEFYHFYECLTRDVVLSGCIPTEQSLTQRYESSIKQCLVRV